MSDLFASLIQARNRAGNSIRRSIESALFLSPSNRSEEVRASLVENDQLRSPKKKSFISDLTHQLANVVSEFEQLAARIEQQIDKDNLNTSNAAIFISEAHMIRRHHNLCVQKNLATVLDGILFTTALSPARIQRQNSPSSMTFLQRDIYPDSLTRPDAVISKSFMASLQPHGARKTLPEPKGSDQV